MIPVDILACLHGRAKFEQLPPLGVPALQVVLNLRLGGLPNVDWSHRPPARDAGRSLTKHKEQGAITHASARAHREQALANLQIACSKKPCASIPLRVREIVRMALEMTY
jgi:hypothetical protein